MLLADYFLKEIETYKKDQVREQTYNKYRSNGRFLIKNFSDLILEKMTADDYQQILNKYAETHEKSTATDFHRQLAWALKRAYNVDGILKRDVTFDAKIPLGKKPGEKKPKFLEIGDMRKLVQELKHEDTPEEIKKVLQALLEDLNDSRKEVEEKWIERVLEDEREMQEWLEDEDYWISDDDGEDGGNSK